MTIEDIQAKRSALENDIASLIHQFENESGLMVMDVDLETVDTTSAASSRRTRLISRIRIKVELP